jgi:hypothetical protein
MKHARVWFQHAQDWLLHADYDDHTQSVILDAECDFTRRVWFSQTREYDFDTYECDYDTHESDYDTHDCDLFSHELNFNTMRVTLTRTN